VDPAEGDDVGVGFFGVVGEAEGIADEVSDFLDFARLVVVGEDDGVPFLFEAEDFGAEVDGGGGGQGRGRGERVRGSDG
jgi:hypothetical protein